MPNTDNTQCKTALITGISGQDGSYLAELLLAKGYRVWGMVRRSSSTHSDRSLIGRLNSSAPSEGARLQLCYGDLSDASSVFAIIAKVRPAEVYNLGAQSHVRASFEMPEQTVDVTGVGTLRLLEGIRHLGLDTRFYQASSSELFGKVQETPQTEQTPFYPRSPYAAAKAYAFHIVRNYREAYGMFAVNGILFNHESPRRGEAFVTRKITKAAAAIACGRQDKLLLGNLDATRDWGFAGDYVEAMWLMMQADKPEDYVVATGKAHSVREFCACAFARAGLSLAWTGEGVAEQGVGPGGKVLVEIDPAYFRPTEVDRVLGDASKAQRQLGWRPRVGVNELAAMMVDADLKALQGDGATRKVA